jgi:hypothetical protein
MSVLAFLGPREEAEGQVKKKPDKAPMPITGTPSGRIIPSPMPVPLGKNVFPTELHSLDDLKKPVGGAHGTKTDGVFNFPNVSKQAVFSPQALPGTQFTAPKKFHLNMSDALGKIPVNSKDWKANLAKFQPQASLIAGNMHTLNMNHKYFTPAWYKNHPYAFAYWHPFHHHKHHPSWWWFHTPNWTTCTDWVVYDWTCPIYYNCGVNVVYRDNYVYVNKVQVASFQDYAYQAYLLAEVVPPPPEQKIDYLGMGMYALTSSRDSIDSDLLIQLAITKEGLIGGTLYNRSTDSTVAVTGQVEPLTQRVAIQLSAKKDLVMDTGFHNLTLSHSCVYIHFGDAATGTWTTQTWFLVRLPPLDVEPK